jgi:hypothetical protein
MAKSGKRAGKERSYFFNPHSAARHAVVIGHIGGLLISTYVTIVFVPILYTLFEDVESALRRLFIHRSSDVPTSPALPPAAL